MTTKDTKTAETLNYDTRLIERSLRTGKLDPKEYEAFLKKLPDEEANAHYIETFEQDPTAATSPETLTFT